jgi:ribosomal-protein-alanine N-acetyltransferase
MTEFAPMPRELRTERLRLRWWLPSDSAAVRRLWAERDPRSLRLINADGHPTETEMRDRISTQLDEGERSGLGMLAIELLSAPGFIGYCGLTVGSATEEEPEIAFELFRAAQGREYATEAAREVVDVARGTGRSRLWATVREWNVASLRVLAKLDFVDSGRRTVDAERGSSVWMTRDISALNRDS